MVDAPAYNGVEMDTSVIKGTIDTGQAETYLNTYLPWVEGKYSNDHEPSKLSSNTMDATDTNMHSHINLYKKAMGYNSHRIGEGSVITLKKRSIETAKDLNTEYPKDEPITCNHRRETR